MNEKAYKTMGIVAAANLAMGIITIVIGVAVGAVAIVGGAHLLKSRKGLTF